MKYGAAPVRPLARAGPGVASVGARSPRSGEDGGTRTGPPGSSWTYTRAAETANSAAAPRAAKVVWWARSQSEPSAAKTLFSRVSRTSAPAPSGSAAHPVRWSRVRTVARLAADGRRSPDGA